MYICVIVLDIKLYLHLCYFLFYNISYIYLVLALLYIQLLKLVFKIVIY